MNYANSIRIVNRRLFYKEKSDIVISEQMHEIILIFI